MADPRELISAYLDGDCTEAQLQELSLWINASHENVREMVWMGFLHRALVDHFQAFEVQTQLSPDEHMSNATIMPAMTEPQELEKSIHPPTPEKFWEPESAVGRLHLWNQSEQEIQAPSPARPRWFAAAAAIALLVLGGISSVMYLSQPGMPTGYARLAASVAPRWIDLKYAPYVGESIPRGILNLRSGLVQVHINGGVSAVIQGPAKFQISSNRKLVLLSGKVAVSVPHSQIGFSVHTPQAVVTDLGTDFGVQAYGNNRTQLVVLKGKVSAAVVPMGGNASRIPSRIITVGNGAKVSNSSILVLPAEKLHVRFVRTLTHAPLALSLVDLMAGGHGLGCRSGIGVDPATGRTGHLAPAGDRKGDGNYHVIKTMPVIDGCFVPEGGKRLDQIDSGGDRYAFPSSTGDSFGNIWAGGKVPWIQGVLPVSTVLDGVNYAQYPNNLLVVHSNSGLTINLGAIRRLYPGVPLRAFRATLGDSFVGPDKVYKIPAPRADVFLLVDGKLVFHKIGMTGEVKPINVNVGLPPHAKYLTLVTTDGGDGTRDAWILWCNPEFELGATDKYPARLRR